MRRDVPDFLREWDRTWTPANIFAQIFITEWAEAWYWQARRRRPSISYDRKQKVEAWNG